MDALPIMGMSKIITYNGEQYVLLHYEGDCWVYLSLDKKKILKRPKSNSSYRQLFKESRLLPKLKDFGLPVPCVFEWNERSATLVEEFISGTSLDRLDKSQVEGLMPHLKEIFSVMNAIEWESFSECGLERYTLTSWRYQLVRWTKLVLAPFLSFNEIKRIIDLINDIFVEKFTPVFLHGELEFCHIILDKESRLWIIDWGDSFFSDPVYDLAFLYYFSGKPRSWFDIFQLSENEWRRMEFYSAYLPAVLSLEEGEKERNRGKLKEGLILLKEAMLNYGFV